VNVSFEPGVCHWPIGSATTGDCHPFRGETRYPPTHDQTAPGSSRTHLTIRDRMSSASDRCNHGTENHCGYGFRGVPNHTSFAGKVHAEARCRSSFEKSPLRRAFEFVGGFGCIALDLNVDPFPRVQGSGRSRRFPRPHRTRIRWFVPGSSKCRIALSRPGHQGMFVCKEMLAIRIFFEKQRKHAIAFG
jgi:hypothetical protein